VGAAALTQVVAVRRTPHMFEFLEDNYLLEWWGDEFRAWCAPLPPHSCTSYLGSLMHMEWAPCAVIPQ
jgi:hypothetical protein